MQRKKYVPNEEGWGWKKMHMQRAHWAGPWLKPRTLLCARQESEEYTTEVVLTSKFFPGYIKPLVIAQSPSVVCLEKVYRHKYILTLRAIFPKCIESKNKLQNKKQNKTKTKNKTNKKPKNPLCATLVFEWFPLWTFYIKISSRQLYNFIFK